MRRDNARPSSKSAPLEASRKSLSQGSQVAYQLRKKQLQEEDKQMKESFA